LTNISELSFQRPTWAEINLDAIHSNYLKVEESVSRSRILAVVKSDAYGHGAVVVAQELQEAGAEFFGTATASEAIQLRLAGIRGRLILLSGMVPQQIPLLYEYDLIPTVYSQQFLKALADSAATRKREVSIHLKVDTGMGRLGFPPEEAAVILHTPPPWIRIEGLCTHFATADIPEDEYTRSQLSKFLEFVGNLNPRPAYIHAANSAAILNYPESHLDLVRPGILLYGLSPLSEDCAGYQPILSLKSKIILLQTIAKGQTIGYGRAFCAARDSVIATVPIGYADGLRRGLSNLLYVEIGGSMCRVVGNISMDLCMIDVTDVADRVQVYDEVTFIGPRTTAWDWARLLETIPYEILCLIGARVPRVYYKGGQIHDVYYP